MSGEGCQEWALSSPHSHLASPNYSYSGLIFQTRSTEYQPSPNLFNPFPPSKWLAPAPRKSYKMFFQKVTHSLPISNMICIGAYELLPSPVTTGYQRMSLRR